MRLIRIMFVVLALSLVAGVLVTPALADQWNKKTVATFNQPVELSGKVLPAGTYVFKLVDVVAFRHVAQIQNSELTLITCFPFKYLGSAPNRFLVRATQLASTAPK